MTSDYHFIKDPMPDIDSIASFERNIYNQFYATDTSTHLSLNLDEFFGYNDARRKTDSGKQAEIGNFLPHLVFMNNIDSFNGKYIGKFLAAKIRGDIAERVEDEGEEIGGLEEKFEETSSRSDKEQSIEIEDRNISKNVPDFMEHFTEYEYLDALYAKYDVGRLTVQEYGELLDMKSHEERLIYLEKKFGAFKQEYTVESGTSMENDKQAAEIVPVPTTVNYQIIGTVKDLHLTNEDLPFATEILKGQLKERKFFRRLLNCGIFLFDITNDVSEIEEASIALEAIMNTLEALKEKRPSEFDEMNIEIIFIVISPLLTWQQTKPVDPEDPDLPFTEKDFKKRRPHPNYQGHLQFEKDLLAAEKKYEGKLKVAIVGIGITYGYEENILHYLFKLAWLNEPELPVFGNGKNMVPLIHVDDLALLIHTIISSLPKSKYIFGIEKTVSNLKEIAKAVCKGLSSGTLKKVPIEEALLVPEITQSYYDKLTANLNMESSVLEEEMPVEFKYESGFVENIKDIAKDFTTCRRLKPIKVIINGPPGSGMADVCRKIAEHYKINYLTETRAVDTYLHDLKTSIKSIQKKMMESGKKDEMKSNEKEEGVEKEGEEEEEDDEDEEEEDLETKLEEQKEKLKEVQQDMEDNEGKVSEHLSAKIVKKLLLSRPFKNQGYIIDGYPQTLTQTQLIFGKVEGDEGEDDEDEEDEDDEKENEENLDEQQNEDEQPIWFNKKIIPGSVIYMEASNDFLYKRLLTDPKNIKNDVTEEEIYNIVKNYRKISNVENTFLTFFDEIEMYPHILNVESPEMQDEVGLFKRLCSLIGETANYESAKMVEWEKLRKDEEMKLGEEKLISERRKFIKLRKDCIKKKLEKWAAEVDRMKEEEEEILAKESIPLRHYLIKYVFPTLTNGLIEVAKVKPEDPVDYLAEYLFKENPDGRQFLDKRKEPQELINLESTLHDFKDFLEETNSFL